MILTTTFEVPGKDYEIIAMVNGNTVQSKNAFKDIGAGLKSIVGGELGSYKKMISEARETVTERMVQIWRWTAPELRKATSSSPTAAPPPAARASPRRSAWADGDGSCPLTSTNTRCP